MNFKEIGYMLWQQSLKENCNAIRKKLKLITPLEGFDSEHPCIFVLSTGRVGTETLSALSKLASEYSVYHEPVPKIYRLGKLSYELNTNDVIESLLTESFFTTRSVLFANALNKGCGYIETSPQVTFFAKIISKSMPNSKFIHLIRSPRDVVRSGMRRKWFNNEEYDGNRIQPTESSAIEIDWEKASDFEKIIWLWAETNNWITKFSENISSDRFIVLQSEAMFDGSKETLYRLFSFLNRKIPRDRLVRKVLHRKLNRQKVGEFPQSSEWTAEMDDKLLKIAGSVMKYHGYS